MSKWRRTMPADRHSASQSTRRRNRGDQNMASQTHENAGARYPVQSDSHALPRNDTEQGQTSENMAYPTTDTQNPYTLQGDLCSRYQGYGDTPQVLYDQPANRSAARYLPELNNYPTGEGIEQFRIDRRSDTLTEAEQRYLLELAVEHCRMDALSTVAAPRSDAHTTSTRQTMTRADPLAGGRTQNLRTSSAQVEDWMQDGPWNRLDQRSA